MIEQLIIAVVPSSIVALITLAGVLKSNKTAAAVRQAEDDAHFASLEREITLLRGDFNDLNKHVKEHNSHNVRISVLEEQVKALKHPA